MGAVFSVPYARLESWPHGLGNEREAGFRLLALTPTPHPRHTLLGDDRAVLERRHRLVDERHDRRAVGLRVPRLHGDERLPAVAVHRADEEVGLAAEAGVDPRVDPRRVGLVDASQEVLRDLDARVLAGLQAAPDLGDRRVVRSHSITLGTRYSPASTAGALAW